MRTARPRTDVQQASPERDSTRPRAERVDLLLAEMTVEEKVAQLGSRWAGNGPRIADCAHGKSADFRRTTLKSVRRVPLEDFGPALRDAEA